MRSVAAIAAAALLALLAAGCGENQVDHDSSNRGSGTDTAPTSVENAYRSQFAPGSCAIQIGDSAQLRFTANRPAESERLLQITTAAADTVRISPNCGSGDCPQVIHRIGPTYRTSRRPCSARQVFHRDSRTRERQCPARYLGWRHIPIREVRGARFAGSHRGVSNPEITKHGTTSASPGNDSKHWCTSSLAIQAAAYFQGG